MEEIAEGMFISRELGDEIVKQIKVHLKRGFSEDRAVKFGIDQAINNYRIIRKSRSVLMKS